jgi:hypothetical protein
MSSRGLRLQRRKLPRTALGVRIGTDRGAVMRSID